MPSANLFPTTLTCEYALNPLGIDVQAPRLSWVPVAEGRRQRQCAYRILVASSMELLRAETGDLWDSGRVESAKSVHVVYAGVPLVSRRRCYWVVRLWDRDGVPSVWSAPACWEMGLLAQSEWTAAWIGAGWEEDPSCSTPCPYLRKEFSCTAAIAHARLYVTALGLYEIRINGRRVGEDYFTPGWTDYTTRVQYQTYDVSGLLHEGANAIGAILADGWFCGYLIWDNNRNVYGHTTRLYAQLEITYVDGRVQTINSDNGWMSATGPLLSADIYHGESYDARLEMAGWDAPGFAGADWRPVTVHPPTGCTLHASASPRVRKIEEIVPIAVTQPTPGACIFDLGQNMVGWVRLKVPVATPAGTEITLGHAEVLNPDGTLYTTNLRSAKCTDRYITRGDAEECYAPRFTFHGFRYVEVSGLTGKLAPGAVTGVVVHSDLPPTGSFTCSHPLLNQLQQNIRWGQKGNFLEVPTDCPQRDERLGWTGDAQLFIRTACFNMQVAGFFSKWMQDLRDAQTPAGAFLSVAPNVPPGQKEGEGGPAWADAGIICPWTIYRCYGDMRILTEHYAAMARYVEYQQQVEHEARYGYGDWLNLDDDTPKPLISTAFFAYTTALMARIAEVLEKPEEAAGYRALWEQRKAAFIAEYVSPAGVLAHESQTAYALALQFELLPAELRAAAAARLVERIHARGDHLSTGIVGTTYLLEVLLQTGYLELAYKLLLNEDFPSWGYPILHGATTMWERWDGWRHDAGFQDPAMNSFNHYAYGAVGDWMYRHIAGLDLDALEAGYRQIVIHPRPGGGLTSAVATYRSPYGNIATAWQRDEDDFTLQVKIPANTTATLYLPGAAADVRESGVPAARAEGVTFLREEDGCAVFAVESGAYSFAVWAKEPAKT